MKPILTDPTELRPHSILAHIPAPAKDDPQVLACADSIRESSGHLLPLVVDEQNHILTDDSRLRWMAARRMGLSVVPVVIQPGALAPVIALSALIHRSHYTKSAIAYIAIPTLKPAFDAATAQHLDCLKRGEKPVVHGVDYGRASTWEEMAEKLGISRALLGAAKQVRGEFEKDKRQYDFEIEGGADDGKVVKQTLREHFEPKILRQQVDSEHAAARPIGLGGVMKAIGSIRSTKGAPKRTDPQLELFTGGFEALSKRFTYWTEFDEGDKAKADPVLDQFLDAMPPDLMERIQAKIKGRLKRMRVE